MGKNKTVPISLSNLLKRQYSTTWHIKNTPCILKKPDMVPWGKSLLKLEKGGISKRIKKLAACDSKRDMLYFTMHPPVF